MRLIVGKEGVKPMNSVFIDAYWRAASYLFRPADLSRRQRSAKKVAMKRLSNACMLLTVGWLAATGFGCGALQSHPNLTLVPISSFDQLAGKWEGLSKRLPDMQDDAWVILIIGENGSFTFVSNRAKDYLLGTGTLAILDGRAHGKTESGTSALTLYDKVGNLVLVVEAALNDGKHYYLEMTPMK